MEIRTWSTEAVFQPPVNGRDIYLLDTPLRKPEGLDEKIRTSWHEAVINKQAELARSGINVEIRPYHKDSSANPLEAIYEGDEPKMWPGPVVTLTGIERDLTHGRNRVNLGVGQMFYPYISALNKPEFVELYESQGIIRPRLALGINTPTLTADNQLTLTVRGISTNQYPRRLYAPGGQPELTSDNVVAHQLDEIEDEILVRPDEVIKDEFIFGGVVVDEEELKGKPDLVGWVRVTLDAGDIRERVLRRDLKDRPNDAVGVVFAPSSEEGLLRYLSEITHPVMFCPPALGSLYIFGLHQYGPDWGSDVLKRMGYE